MKSIELAFIRNELYKGVFLEEHKAKLQEIKDIIKTTNNPFSGLIQFCINNAINDVKIGAYRSAAEEINFIHNFPIESDFKNWDEKHFYTIELLGYIEKSENVERIKEIIKVIANFI